LAWAKWKILVQISVLLFLKSYGGSYDELSEPGFPHNFAPKKKRSPGPKNGLYRCVSTPATLCAQNWGLNIFLDEIMAILVLPDHFPLATAFS
jgi:hypothetical protein